MVFSSFLFLFLFLPLCVSTYFIFPKRFKNTVLLFWSYLFYAWGAPTILGLLLLSTLSDFWLSKRIINASKETSKRWLTLAVAINLVLLAYFKYSNFFIAEVNSILTLLGLSQISWVKVALPIGISFFTFQKISYLVDVYRKKVEPAKNIINYALFVTLFPQLIAGPIIRYHDIDEQIRSRQHSLSNLFFGLQRFCIGFIKKILIADPMGAVADNVFALSGDELSTSYAWLGILCYSFQIYFDFSAYSDMAIGLGRIFGFRFLENFNMPYTSLNITEFWRRWHISLSNWMREYLYFSLGGNRVGKARMYLNLWVVFLLSGLWHGASWNFIIWGAFHGTFLVLDKSFWLEFSKRLPKALNISLTFFVVLIGWVFFRAETLTDSTNYLAHMFALAPSPTKIVLSGDIIHNRASFVFCLAIILSFLPCASRWQGRLEPIIRLDEKFYAKIIPNIIIIFLFALALGALAAISHTPFLYFRF